MFHAQFVAASVMGAMGPGDAPAVVTNTDDPLFPYPYPMLVVRVSAVRSMVTTADMPDATTMDAVLAVMKLVPSDREITMSPSVPSPSHWRY